MDKFKIEQMCKIGVGGLKCGCCNMYKGIYRKKLNRLARKSLKNKTRKEVEIELLL